MTHNAAASTARGQYARRDPGGDSSTMRSRQDGRQGQYYSEAQSSSQPLQTLQHSRQTHMSFTVEAKPPLPPPPTKIPLCLDTCGVQSTPAANAPQVREVLAEQSVFLADQSVSQRTTTAQTRPGVAPLIPDRNLYPTTPTRAELDAVLSECVSYQTYASSVIDNRQIMEEARDARQIEGEVMDAIMTGKFPSLQELEENKEALSTRMLEMSFEGRLTNLPELEKVNSMIRREKEKLLTLRPPHENTGPILGPETPSVFLSYTGQDERTSLQCSAALFASSLSVALDSVNILNFFDASTLQSGEPWKKEIARSVAGCVVFVCILSPTFPFRKWCMHELDLALAGNKKVLPVCLGSEFYEHTDEFRICFYEAHRQEGIPDKTIRRWEQNIFDLREIQGVRISLICKKTAFEGMKGNVVAAIQRMLQRTTCVREAQASETRTLSTLSREMPGRLRVIRLHAPPKHTTTSNGNDSGHDDSGDDDSFGDDYENGHGQRRTGGARGPRPSSIGSGAETKQGDNRRSERKPRGVNRCIDQARAPPASSLCSDVPSTHVALEGQAGASSLSSKRIEAPPGSLGIVARGTMNGLEVQRVEHGSPLQDRLFPGDLVRKIGNVDLVGLKRDNLEHMLSTSSPETRIITVMRVDGHVKHQPLGGLTRSNTVERLTKKLPAPLSQNTEIHKIAEDTEFRASSDNSDQACSPIKNMDGLTYKSQVNPLDPPVHHGEVQRLAPLRETEPGAPLAGVLLDDNHPFAVGVLVEDSPPSPPPGRPTDGHSSDSSPRGRGRIKKAWKRLTKCVFKPL